MTPFLAELSRCDKDLMASKAKSVFTIWPFTEESLQTPVLDHGLIDSSVSFITLRDNS